MSRSLNLLALCCAPELHGNLDIYPADQIHPVNFFFFPSLNWSFHLLLCDVRCYIGYDQYVWTLMMLRSLINYPVCWCSGGCGFKIFGTLEPGFAAMTLELI